MNPDATRRSTAIVIAMLLAAVSPLATAAETPGNIDALRQHALELVNRSRDENGLQALTLGDDAVNAAQAHTDDMFRRDYYAHDSPEGGTARDRYIDAGGSEWELVAENIARCENCAPPATDQTVEDLHKGWMNSPPHRRNILTPGLTSFGFGLTLSAQKGIYADQTFAGPGQPRDLAPGEEAVTLDAAQAGERALAAVNKAREKHHAPALRLDPALRQAAEALMPPAGEKDFTLSGGGDLLDALPGSARGDWASLDVVAGACGGCGTVPAAADIRQFADDWMNDPTYRATLLEPDATHLGFALQASGEGRKIAVLVLGQHR